jgi:hypothetical protein
VLLAMKVFCALKVASGALRKQAFIKPSYEESNPAVALSNREDLQRGGPQTNLFPCAEGNCTRRGLLRSGLLFLCTSWDNDTRITTSLSGLENSLSNKVKAVTPITTLCVGHHRPGMGGFSNGRRRRVRGEPDELAESCWFPDGLSRVTYCAEKHWVSAEGDITSRLRMTARLCNPYTSPGRVPSHNGVRTLRSC